MNEVESVANSPEFQALSRKVSRMEVDLAANTASTLTIEKNTHDLVEAFQAAKGAFNVLTWLGKVAKVLSPIALFGGILAADWKRLITYIASFWK